MIQVLILALAMVVQARTGSVTGRIQSQDGTPAVGVRVSALQSGDMMGVALTDSEGRYELKGIAPGPYVIAAGLIGSFTYSPGTTDESKAVPVAVRADAVVANVDFKLAATAGVRIRGVVEAPAGNFPRAREATLGEMNEVVQADGSFEFRGVKPGNYTIEFAPTGQDIAIKVGNANLDNLRVKAPAVITARVFVEEGGPLLTSPSLVNSAAVKLTIATTPTDGSGLTHHQVTNTGTSAFMLPRGHQYQAEMYNLPFGYYVKSMPTKLDIDEDTATRNIDVVLTAQRPPGEEPGVTVRGRVISTAPIPAGFQVWMTMTPPFSYHAVRVEPDGSFVFRNVPAGPYSLAHNGGASSYKPVVVRDTDIDNVELTIAAQVTLKGRLQIDGRSASTPRPSLFVAFVRADNFGRSVALSTDTFNVNLLEGTYVIFISEVPARFAVKSITLGSQDVTSKMVIDASKPAEEFVITLQDKGTP
jgi:hypothetical protein